MKVRGFTLIIPGAPYSTALVAASSKFSTWEQSELGSGA
jgi:hypothetical protein